MRRFSSKASRCMRFAGHRIINIDADCVQGRVWYTSFRGRLWIAAAAKVVNFLAFPFNVSNDSDIQKVTDEEIVELEAAYTLRPELKLPENYPISCLLGCVDVVDCLSQEDYRTKVVASRMDRVCWSHGYCSSLMATRCLPSCSSARTHRSWSCGSQSRLMTSCVRLTRP